MDASDLYYVARHLLAASRRVIVPDMERGLAGTDRLVLEDLVEAAPTTVVEIARRTHIAQSRVSTIIAEWRRRGAIDVAVDPLDRRRTLVMPSESLKAQYNVGAVEGLDAVLDQLGVSLGLEDRLVIAQGLERLHRRLRPDHC